MNNNIHRKLTEEDRFACRCPNNNGAAQRESAAAQMLPQKNEYTAFEGKGSK